MKIFYTSIFAFCSVLISAQDFKKIDFSELDKTGMKTDLLLTQSKPFSVLTDPTKTHYSMFNFSDSYRELAEVDAKNRFTNKEIKSKLQNVVIENQTVRIGLIHTEFDVVSRNAFDNNLVALQENKLKKITDENVFENHIKTIVTPLATRKKGLKTTFRLDDDFLVNTTDNAIVSVKADFGDGKGFRKININQDVNVIYPDKGNKTLAFKIKFQDGTTIYNTSSLEIAYSSTDLYQTFSTMDDIQNVTSQYTADLSLYGQTDSFAGKCEVGFFLSPDGILDKPIFVVDGFDPGDLRDIQAIYNSLSYTDSEGQQNLADQIREQGYDVIIVNFPVYENNGTNVDGGADYIERNALSLATVINSVNTDKVGNEQNVIIGPSMGGLVSRYALRYMETNNIDHDTRLWVSFDSPHYGANVPIGLQNTLGYFAYGIADLDAIKLIFDNMLRSPAAKQLLIDHFDGHTSGSFSGANPTVPDSGFPLEPTGAPNYRDNFQNRMNELGFPQNTRNVVITNGSGNGTVFNDKNNNPVTPGFKLIDGTIEVELNGINNRLIVETKFMPEKNITTLVSDIKIQTFIFVWITVNSFKATAKQHGNSDGVDTAPGGLFGIGDLSGGTGDPMVDNFLNMLKAEYFNFIPTVSALALENQPDYYHNINLGEGSAPWSGNTTTNSQTPFVNWYMPTENQPHMTTTQGNADFLWAEIVNPNLSTENHSVSDNLVVYPNPSRGIFNVNGLDLKSDTQIKVIDLGGRVIQEKNYVPYGQNLEIDLRSAQQGTYFVVFESENQKIVRKIIKK